MARIPICRTLVLFSVALLFSYPAAADSIQLANGEVLKGKVLSLDDKQITFESESIGKLTLDRKKVATITFGDAKPPALVADPKVGTSPAPGSVEDAFKQLKGSGANPKDVNELRKLFPELDSPEASKYFDETLKGVMAGKKDIQDIRKDAIKARDELKKLTEDLGEDVGAATKPYLNILEKFIRETEPKDKTAPKDKAEPNDPTLKKVTSPEPK